MQGLRVYGLFGHEVFGVIQDEKPKWTWSRVLRCLLGVEVIILLALVQVMWSGYRLGVGNQSIQIPFLKHEIDKKLYTGDRMVEQTLPFYSSYFYKGLAKIVTRVDRIIDAYFWLHVLTAAAVLAAAYGLGRAMFKSRAAGIVLVLILLAGHHRALAGDDLYSVGFTHTWAVFPMAIAAIALLYANWPIAAFAVAGLIFNLHALTAGYLFVMFGAWSIFEIRKPGAWWRLPAMLAVFFALASPTLLEMLRQKQTFTAQWMELTRLRSADHSFPSTWWQDGTSDVPRFLLIAGLAAVAMSFTTEAGARRKSLLMFGGAAALFLGGTVFSELWTSSTVIRAQLFRASRLVMVLMLAHVAWGVVCGLEMARIARLWKKAAPPPPWNGSSDVPPPAPVPVLAYESPQPASTLGTFMAPVEFVLAALTLLCVAVPGLLTFAPWVLLLGMIVALGHSRLGWGQAAIACIALLVSMAAWKMIGYHIPGVDEGVGSVVGEVKRTLETRAGDVTRLFGPALWTALAVAAMVWVIAHMRIGPRVKLCALVAVHFVCVMIALHGHRNLSNNGARKDDDWIMVQHWAKAKTKPEAIFLVPDQPGGFRIHSERPVVGEWRDGTQLYFAASFAPTWQEALNAIRPAMYDQTGRHEIHRKTLAEMTEAEIIERCRKFKAAYVVLPAGRSRNLRCVYENDKWAVFEARIDLPEGAVADVWQAQEQFIEEVAKPNIEKYRKGDAAIELVDESGKAIGEGNYEVRLTNHAFNFGVSLPPFADLTGMYAPEWVAPKVTEAQLERVKGVFNYSMIPFGGKWNYLEPEQGKPNYGELDAYVDWCAKHNIRMEFHYLSGFTPQWGRSLNSLELKDAWFNHCRTTVARYHDRIKHWQIVNNSYMINYTAEILAELRQKYPDLKFGVSHCSQFYAEAGESRMFTGSEDIEIVKAMGGKLDYYASHAHKPNGLWPDARVIYKVLDGFAAYGLRIHMTEATLDFGLPILGPVRTGHWNAELAADFWEFYYTVGFSHPAVDAINYWDLGPSVVRAVGRAMGMGGTGNAGLIDPTTSEPRPAYNRIKELITQRWTTKLDGAMSSEGKVAVRGFYGDYEAVVTLPTGKTLKGTFNLKKDGEQSIKVTMKAQGASVVKSE